MEKIVFDYDKPTLGEVLGLSKERMQEFIELSSSISEDARKLKTIGKKMELFVETIKPQNPAEYFLLGYGIGVAISKDVI